MLHGLALTATHFGVWVSSLIVMGIMSYLISRSAGGVYYERNTHTIYEEVIAVLTFVIYTFVVITSFLKATRSHIMPLSFVLSYLWLTSFILSVQDWAGSRCAGYSFGYGDDSSNKCGIKKTAIAFNFFTFFFFLCTLLADRFLTTEGGHFGRKKNVAAV
ncbi:hypothetical protein VHEMI04026 [[Torrubiella] hemipterigena]|uniref:MARVEL domain-containing protein n=1 Tax=[Torrubiella] hemipterigena TaxID=1531966 RepID=A0A0A1T054_9HYPO|nr:hypothetical protein VHEMI04026 [[Torrubiella] hemipterigena]